MAHKDLSVLKELDFVSKFSLEDCMLDIVIEGTSHSVMIPDDYPRGEAVVFGARNESLRPGNLESIAYQLLQMTQQMTNLSDDWNELSQEYMHQDATSAKANVQKDIDRYTAVNRGAKVSYRSLDICDWVDIEIPLNFLQESTAKAWGVTSKAPLEIRLKFSTKAYIEESSPPRVEITQSGAKVPLGQQMARALQVYLSSHWNNRWVPSSAAATNVGARQTAMAAEEGHRTKDRKRLNLPALNALKEELYEKLVEMGFEDDDAHLRAKHCETVGEALDFTFESLPAAQREETKVKEPKVTLDAIGDPKFDKNKYIPWVDENGFLCHIADFMRKRIPTCCNYCVICDQPHLFGAANMLRPSICSRAVCCYAFHELNVGSDSAESVATDAGVVELLIALFHICALSSRNEKVLDPFPSVADPNDKSKLALDPSHKDCGRLKKALSGFPTVEEVVETQDFGTLKAKLDTREPLAFPLLQWVINSNRSLIVKLNQAQYLPSINTPHQFLLLQAPPEKQAKFAKLKEKHGSKFAFHGSGAENWHSILRNGLKNATGTKLELNGHAHGSGIYLAPQASSSLGYSRAAGSVDTKRSIPKRFLQESSLLCLALVEVITTGIKDHSWCWTVQDEDYCMSRFFFVFDCNNPGDCNADTHSGEFNKEITKAMEYHGLS